MTVAQTALVFVGIPLAVVLVVAGLVFGLTVRKGTRYRPDLPFSFTPVWFVAPNRAEPTLSSRMVTDGLYQGGARDNW